MGFRWFDPLLAGAGQRDRLVAGLGGAIGISVTTWLAWFYAPPGVALFLAGSIGASTVLVFAVPSSPLAQPWPAIGGAVASALFGVAVVRLLDSTPLSAGIAVGGAILLMSLLRCLHPPGGGYALAAVLGGDSALSANWHFAFVPVGINATILVLTAIAFHRLSGHSYPHRVASSPSPEPGGLRRADVEAALAEMGETFDIAPEDLDALLAAADRHARARRTDTAGGGTTRF